MPTTQNNVIIGTDETPAEVGVGGHISVAQTFDQVVPLVRTAITSESGGRQLENIPCGAVTIRNGSGNSAMIIGGVGQYAIYSGRGLSLYANETITIPVKNANAVTLMAMVSGQHIEGLAFLTGPNVPVDTSGMFIPPDTIPPTIMEVSPMSGISGVSTFEPIWVMFDECMDPASIDINSFVVRVSGSSVNVSGIVSADSMHCEKFYFSAYSGTISGGTMYRATLGTSIMDVAGNSLAASGVWHWTTIGGAPAPDTILPNVSGISPGSGDLNVDVSVIPMITFSEQLQSGSIEHEKITLSISGINLHHDVELMEDLRTVMIHHDMGIAHELDNMKAYTITVDSGAVMDLAGNAISGTYTSRFFTEDGNITLAYNVSPGTSGIVNTLDNDEFRIGHRVRLGTNPTYIGEQMVKIRMHMRRSETPLSGVVSGLTVHIRKAAGGNVIQFGLPFQQFLNPAVLSTSLQTFDFYNSDNFHQFQENDRIEVQWLSGTPNSGRVRVANVNVNMNDGLIYNEYGGSTYSGANYTEFSGRDVAGMIWVR